MEAPFDKRTIDAICEANGLCNARELGHATIRQVVAIVSEIERTLGIRYVRMEMGVPGLEPSRIGIEAEREALLSGIAARYPDISGIGELKREASRFIKAFIDIDVPAACCIPTVGSMQGAFVTFLACCQADRRRDKVLFIDPGFPVQKQQLRVLGIGYRSFDVADYRGGKLRGKIESCLREGDIAAIVYSNPNNPSWMCLTEEELKTIGSLATEYDVVAVEDLASLNMDFRRPLGKPFAPPFQASVARYTDNYILLLSASKIFSYAGQRGALVAIGERIFERDCPDFRLRYNQSHFGRTFVHSILYTLSAGVTHSVQYAMAAMLRAASDGRLDFTSQVSEYGRRAARLKRVLCDNGFHVVYDTDVDERVGDGFFFTFGYKQMSSEQLINKLIYYGVSAIPLSGTGSDRHGLRACTSSIDESQYELLDRRLRRFAQDY